MAKKLGRGLSHLLPTAPSAQSATRSHPEYQEIPIGEIVPNPEQPRKQFNEREIEELAATLHSVGLIEPVIVRRLEDRYQLISGERRWRACRKAGFKRIPALVKKLNDVQALEMGIIENIQREDLSPIEEARAYEALIEKTGIKPSALAERVGKDRTTVTNLLRLLKLPEPVLDLLSRGELTAGQARPLLSLGDRQVLLRTARTIATQGWSARRVEDEVAKLTDSAGSKSGARSGKSASRVDANTRALEEKIRRKLMAKVKLDHSKKGGKLTIHYGNLEDLERIMELLGIRV